MTAKDNYSFEPFGTVDPTAPIVKAVPSATPETHYNEDEGPPSDTAIMVGCGLIGCVIGGPFLAIVTGFGGKYLADRNQGPIGDSAIALGKIAAAAGKKAKEEHLFSKLKDSVRSLFSKKDQGATSK
mmetsp:Transcript_6750/g.14748  ORF Transcript_6750/g.14748 Transcript_6750/m.14748 type:complete len:127 (+) Transcript_6750:1226-1606(+)